MGIKKEIIGHVDNPEHLEKQVDIPTAVIIIGAAAMGTYVGFQIGGPVGAAVGALVGAFVGALAACVIKRFRVRINAKGDVEVEYETRFA